LSFTIINKPLWASFNTQTGEISGTPEQSDIGVTSNITISVSDDELTAQLTDFNIEVTAVGEGVPPIPSSYCSVESNNDWEWIGGVSIGEFSQNSIEKGSGYTDLSGYTFYVKGGSDSNVILVAAGDIGYDRRWLFSIDLNQDDSFSLIAEDGESFYIGDGDGSTDIEGTLNIPQEFIGVTTRLRVNMRTEGGDILPCGEDGDAGYGDIADFTLKILGDAPDITGTPNTSILLGNNYNFTPTSFDIDGNELSFAIENAPLWSIFNTDTGQLSGEPTSDYIGLYENIIITVTDEFGFSSSLPAFNINVLDNMPPVINTPANIVIAASNATGTLASNDAIINYLTSAVALDAVDGLVFVSHNAPELFPLGETTVTFYATDGSGNEATTQSTVTITDQSQPEITLLGNFAMTINYGEVYNEPGFSALDNVDGELTQSVVVTGNVISTLLGLYTLNYNLADSAGNNAAQLTRQITVVDITAPIISVPSNIVIAALNADGTAIIDNEIAAFLASATASDNVDGPLTVIHNATGVLALGINTITFSATDNAGNTATAQTQITIVDQSKPVITLIGNTSITLSLGEDYNELGFTALDNVDGVLTQSVIVTGYVNNDLSGLYTLNYNLTDTAGNYAAQLTRQITVVDITAPIISAPTDIVIAALNAEGTPIIDNEIAAFLTAATASDIVDGPLTVRHNAPDVLALGMHTITFSATDNAGNTTTAQAKITIVDQSKPVISLIGNTSITLSFGELYSELGFTAIDNVDGNLTDTVIVEGTIDSYKIGTYTLTYRVTDATNNISTEVTRQITVQDADAPVVTAPNNIIIAAINADGVSIDVDIINDFLLFATAIDNADSEMKVTNDSPEIFPIGVTVVTFSATDSSSNTGTAQAIVTVSDQSAPIIILEGETSITLSINALYIEPGFSVLDNVDGDLSEAVIIEGIIDHSTVGTYTLTYSVTDAAENMSIEVTRQITVQDATAPVVTAPNNIIIAATDADGASSYINVINDFLLFATANDIVDSEVTVTSDAPETFPLGITEVTFSATDNSGNTGTAQATVTVTDQNSPVIILNGEASITLDIDTLYIEPGFSALDNVDGDLSESVNIEGSIDTTLVGIYTLTYNVSDVASNAATELIREVVVIDFTLIDTDNDGTPDGDDAFPFDDSETSDNDGDDLGDNIDPDDDNDGVLDINDAFPLISLNGLKDSDNDGIPDDCGTNCFNMFSDTDDDNDLIPDIDEIFFGLNPLDASDADADLDGDGLSNLNEFLSGSDLFQDSTPPVIFINDNLIVNASGPLTPVDLSDVSATDLVDGNVMVQASTMGPFTTGSHTIVWQATDIAGNMASVEQVLIVQPYININMPAKAQEGDEVSLDFTLNGKPAFYPVEIPYSVQGSALSPEDHDLVSGIAIIEQGTQTKINFTIVDDGNDEGDEQIVVVLGQPFNAALGEFSEKSLIISEEVVLPALSLIAKQAEQRVRIITNNLGIVTVSAVVENAVDLTDYTLNWHVSNAIVSFSTDINSINFDPSNLTAGLYNVQLDIIHKVDIQKTTSMTLDLVVLSQQPILTAAQDSDNDGIDDITEGLTDSDGDGVADYADALTNRNLLQGHEGSQIEQQQTFILQSTSGTRLTLGQTSLAANNNSAQISTTDISMFGLTSDGSDNNYVFPIGLYDFEVHGLPQAGDSVEVIIALMGAIPENGVYRKFVADNWVDFAEDSKNILASAPGSLGICPAPGHESYQPGLTAGYFCLSLTIEDGGMNDSDAMVNGIVKDPGGIAVYTQPDEIVIQPIEEIKTKTSGGSIFILLLVMLCALRQKRFMQIN
ncbi:MAG: DUF5011 domain-containing protein, partial [Colwellia sp.]|nr:DUF5011 domain-containing protein [Colwellia sp.]